MVVPGRLGSEPEPRSTTHPTTTTTTTDDFGLQQDSVPNPLRLYPHRPGAKYEDVEARRPARVTLGGADLRIFRATVVPHTALPRGLAPSGTAAYERLGLVDGYAPRSTATTGDLLHVIVQVTPRELPAWLTCVATMASDGTVLVPYARRPSAPHRNASTSSSTSASSSTSDRTTTSTVLPALDTTPFTFGAFLPLGARRGRVYFTCRNTLFAPGAGTAESGLAGLLVDDTRAVWAINV
jgi:hypothetical protein